MGERALVGLIVLLGLLGASPVASAATTRSAAVRYAAGADSVAAATADWAVRMNAGARCAGNVGVAGACFKVRHGEQQVRVKVNDVSRRHVSGTITFVRSGAPAAAIEFCRTASLAVPAGVTQVRVALDASTIGCGLRSGGVATTGHIRAQFFGG